MVAEDIGSIIFTQILQMKEYPGAPFTGNIMNDLIMFMIVPTVFIIIIVFMASGRIVHGHSKMRLMLGVSMYLFIIAGGYYSAFALLAGPYFIILIFLIGIVGFITGHFRSGGTYGGAGGSYSGGKGGDYIGERPSPGRFKKFLGMGEINPETRRELEHELRITEETLERLDGISKTGGKVDSGEVRKLIQYKNDLERSLYGKARRR